MRLCFFLEPLEPRRCLSAGFLAASGDLPLGAVTVDLKQFAPTNPKVLLQPDGKILLSNYQYKDAAHCNGDLRFFRYNPDGSLDTTFGRGGVALTPCFPVDFDQLLPQPDGKIIGIFTADSIYRFNADGSLDRSFNAGFKLPLRDDRYWQDYMPEFVALAPDGDVITAGEVLSGGDGHLSTRGTLIRLNPDGTRDAAFGSDGLLDETYAAPFGSLGDVIVQPDGKILATGATPQTRDGWHYTSPDTLLRFNPDGTPDQTFASGGRFSFSDGEGPGPIRLQPDGKIVELVYRGGDRGASPDLNLIRLNPDGTLDETFGDNGRFSFSWNLYVNQWEKMFLQPDGKILVVDINGIVARVNSDGTVDESFGFGGAMGVTSTDPHFSYWIDDAAYTDDGHLLLVMQKNDCVKEGYCDSYTEHFVSITTGSEQLSRLVSADENFTIREPQYLFAPLDESISSPDDETPSDTDTLGAIESPNPQHERRNDSNTSENSLWNDSDDPLDWENPALDAWAQ